MIFRALIAIVLCVSALTAGGIYDTIPEPIIYGVSHEPMMYTDTITGRYWQSGSKFYIVPVKGKPFFAAWVTPRSK
jgi:hypothetical protein